MATKYAKTPRREPTSKGGKRKEAEPRRETGRGIRKTGERRRETFDELAK